MGCCAKKESRVENNSVKIADSAAASNVTGNNPEVEKLKADLQSNHEKDDKASPKMSHDQMGGQKYTDHDRSHSIQEVKELDSYPANPKKSTRDVFHGGREPPSTNKERHTKHHLTAPKDEDSLQQTGDHLNAVYNQNFKKSATNLDVIGRKNLFSDMRSGKSPRKGDIEVGKKNKPSPTVSNRSRIVQGQNGMDNDSLEIQLEKEGSIDNLTNKSQSMQQSRRMISEQAIGQGSSSFGRILENEVKVGASQTAISPFAAKKTKPLSPGQVAYAVFKSLNAIRTNPKYFAERIEHVYIEDLDNNGILMSRDIQTVEGKSAFMEAKGFLESTDPVPKLKLDQGLTVAAYFHSKHMAQANTLTHVGKNNTNVADRIEEYGNLLAGAMAENILGSEELDVEEWTLNFVVDDSFPQRAHRKNLFNPDLELVGIGATCKEGLWYIDVNFSSSGYKAKQQKIAKIQSEFKGLRKYLQDCFEQAS